MFEKDNTMICEHILTTERIKVLWEIRVREEWARGPDDEKWKV